MVKKNPKVLKECKYTLNLNLNPASKVSPSLTFRLYTGAITDLHLNNCITHCAGFLPGA